MIIYFYHKFNSIKFFKINNLSTLNNLLIFKNIKINFK